MHSIELDTHRPRVRVQNLSKTYSTAVHPGWRFWDLILNRASKGEQFVALRNVSLELPPAHTLGLVGRNGSGKSTLLQILCGTLTPSSGQVRVEGKIAALLELGSGFNPEFTGRDNVFLNGSLLGMTRREIELAFDSICAFAEIGHYIDQPVKTYSSGMFVRLAFAVVIHTKPDLLVVDEALAVGDARFQAKCLNAIRQLKAGGVAIVLVTHDVAMVRQICDSAVWLHEGAVMMQGDVNQVTSAYTQHLFSGEESSAERSSAVPALRGDGPPDAASPHPDFDQVPATAWQPNLPPLSRWGSMSGALTGCLIRGSAGFPIQTWQGCETVAISVRFRLTRPVPLETLSVALAIKDVRGHDLLVLSSWDRGWRFSRLLVGQEEIVTFSFANPLNAGKYTLVTALEDRQQAMPHYYDFIEGAQFVEVQHESTYMGLMVIPTEVDGKSLVRMQYTEQGLR